MNSNQEIYSLDSCSSAHKIPPGQQFKDSCASAKSMNFGFLGYAFKTTFKLSSCDKDWRCRPMANMGVALSWGSWQALMHDFALFCDF